jgi:dihydrofolate synthase/folylpolyglutamate synthase
MFQTIESAINWIESVKRFGDKLDLSRMELACKILGNPEKKLPVIHIAGTNGKGSTVSYLKHILLEQGYNVGTFTSPYIVRFNERITYNYNDISNDELIYYINKVKLLSEQVFEQYNQVITFFELITLISFLFFTDMDIDYVIYEVGLGGRLDATNVVAPMIAGITTIGHDHMGVLGDTLPEIALEKLGIVKQGVPLCSSVNNKELLPLFEAHTQRLNSSFFKVNTKDVIVQEYGNTTTFKYKDSIYKINMIGTHQPMNASLAIEIIHQLNKMHKATVSEESIKAGLFQTYWPGRLERFGNVILDGAHNVEGANALKESMETYFKDQKIKVLYTSMADKEYFDIIKIIEKFAHEIYFTSFDYPRCETADNLYQVSDFNHKHIRQDALAALRELKQLDKNEILLITGSLYFISYIRKAL